MKSVWEIPAKKYSTRINGAQYMKNQWKLSIFLLIVLQAQAVFPCSTFMLKGEDCHIYGHNMFLTGRIEKSIIVPLIIKKFVFFLLFNWILTATLHREWLTLMWTRKAA